MDSINRGMNMLGIKASKPALALQLDCEYISARMHSSPYPKEKWVQLILLTNNSDPNYANQTLFMIKIMNYMRNLFIVKTGSPTHRITPASELDLIKKTYNFCHQSCNNYRSVTYFYGNNSYKFSENVINFITKETGQSIYDFLPLPLI